MITHDLGVVAEMADEIAVMYAGRIVEKADTDTIFAAPEHPYTWGLLSSIPRLDSPRDEELVPISGRPPSLINLPGGCSFHPRCPYVREAHKRTDPMLEPVPGDARHEVACLLAPEIRRKLWSELQQGIKPDEARRTSWRRRPYDRAAPGQPSMRGSAGGSSMARQRDSSKPPGEKIMEVHGLFKHFPIHAGFFRRQVGAVKAVDGVSFDVCGARRSGSWASRAAASPRPRGCCCA